MEEMTLSIGGVSLKVERRKKHRGWVIRYKNQDEAAQELMRQWTDENRLPGRILFRRAKKIKDGKNEGSIGSDWQPGEETGVETGSGEVKDGIESESDMVMEPEVGNEEVDEEEEEQEEAEIDEKEDEEEGEEGEKKKEKKDKPFGESKNWNKIPRTLKR